ncbi:MAG: IS66 family transposase [Longimicrobiales bacterium]|nr:IS66 family transposase [Longimicrobiales bacterium]
MADLASVRFEPADARAAGPAFAQVRETARSMVAEGRGEEAFDFLLTALAAVLKKSRELEMLLAKLRRMQAGKTSERVDPGQLALLFEELVAQLGTDPEALDALDPEAEARADAELEREIEEAREARGEREPKPSPGWRTRDVPKEVHHVEVAAEARTCSRCGGQKSRIGEDVSRVLAYVPGHFVEHAYELEKWACGTCKRGVTTAPGPDKLIARSAADASLLAHVVVSKYVDHTPLHRLHRIYERSGATIPVSTLSDWVGEVASVVEPLVERLAARIVQDAYVVRTDATGLEVLDPQSPENIQRGTIWCMVGDDRDVVFRYTPTGEGATGPWAYLAGRRGYIQADAAGVFDRLFNGAAASAIEVGCWSHGRRRFVALQDTDCRVAYPIKLITRLYRIEKLADVCDLSAEERAALRHTRSRPVLDTLQRWIVVTAAKEPPSGDLARAAAYVLNHWTALTRFVDDGLLGLDNNLCERQIRDVALGRKNFLFAGSHDAAHRSAALYSLMRTAAQHGVAPLPYLTDVLKKLASGWDHDRLDELLPDRWQPGPAPP